MFCFFYPKFSPLVKKYGILHITNTCKADKSAGRRLCKVSSSASSRTNRAFCSPRLTYCVPCMVEISEMVYAALRIVYMVTKLVLLTCLGSSLDEGTDGHTSESRNFRVWVLNLQTYFHLNRVYLRMCYVRKDILKLNGKVVFPCYLIKDCGFPFCGFTT